MTKLDIAIEGMHCGSCATGIQMLVSQMEGVDTIFVDYDKKKGTVKFDPKKVTKGKIFSSIKDLGYTPS